MSKLNVKLVDTHARAPTIANELVKGFYLYSAQDMVLGPQTIASVRTGVKIQVPDGFAANIASSHHSQSSKITCFGTSNFKEEIVIVLNNFSNEPHFIQRGDIIAKLMCQRTEYPTVQVVEDFVTQ
jgi:dUTP pyrophosphatase